MKNDILKIINELNEKNSGGFNGIELDKIAEYIFEVVDEGFIPSRIPEEEYIEKVFRVMLFYRREIKRVLSNKYYDLTLELHLLQLGL